jgi:PAS domain S-box-containing protein
MDSPDVSLPPLGITATDILESVSDAFFFLDREWRFAYVNRQAEALLGKTADECRGQSVWELFPEAVGTTFYTEYHRAMERGESVRFTEYYPPLHSWFAVTAYPAEKGIAVYFRNVNDEREREATLRESEERFRQLAESIESVIYITEQSGVKFVSPAYERLWGRTRASLYEDQRSFIEAIHPEDQARVLAALVRQSRGEPTVEEYRVVGLDGTVRWARDRAFPLLSGKDVARVFGVVDDITEARKSQQALQEQFRITRAIAENADSPLMLLTREGFTSYANPAFYRVTGYKPEDTHGKTAHDLIHYRYPDGRPFPIEECPIDNAYWNLKAERNLELTFVRKDGSLFPVIAHVAPLKDEDGAMHGGVLEFRDVTEERAREGSLQFLVDLEEKLRAEDDPAILMALAARLLVEHLGVDRCTYAQVDEAEVHFTALGDFARNGLPSLVGTYPLAAFGESILEGHRGGETFVLSDRDRELAGTPEHPTFLATGIRAAISVPIKKREKLVAIMGTHSQQTRDWKEEEVRLVEMVANRCWAHIEQLQYLRALKENADQYRQIAEGLPQMVWTARPDGTRDYFNNRWLDYTGVGVESGENPWASVLHPEDRERGARAWSEAVASGSPFQAEYRLRAKDGKYRWYLGRAIPLRSEKGKVLRYFGTCTDIHGQKAIQRVLEITNDFAMTLAHDLDLERIVQSLTDASTQAIGAQFGSFFYNVVDEQGEAFLLYTLSGAPRDAFEKFGLPRATQVFGPTFRGEGVVRSDDITNDPRYGRMGPPHHGMPQGHLPVVSYLAVPVTSRSGDVIGGLFFGHPQPAMFTEEHETIVSSFAAQASVALDNARLYDQVKGMNQELERKVAERTFDLLSANERLQGFTYHVSHDLRAPLRAIVSTSRIIQEDFGHRLPAEANELLDRQAEAANKMGQLVDDLLKLSRLARQDMSTQELDLTEMAKDAAAEALSMHPYSKVQVEVEEGVRAQADPRLLRLVLLNLIENGIKYSPNGGTVKVGTRGDGAFFVSDEGIGIEAKYLDKIFEPFQRLHRDEEFKGTGIGLANVRQVVERHGGKVWVESELGRGSRFCFTLG